MDFQRLLLFLALSFVVLLLWQAWQQDYGPQPPAPVAQQDGRPDLPQPPGGQAERPVAPEPKLASGERVEVVTDVLRVTLDTRGGDVRQLELLAYPVSRDQPDHPVSLLADQGQEIHIAQSGLRVAAGSSAPAPDHHALFKAERTHYQLEAGQSELKVRLIWQDQGVEVAKIYTFRRGDYLITVDYEVRNETSGPWAAHMYRQLQRTEPAEKRSAFGVYTYTGGVIYSPEEKYEKISFDDMRDAPLNRKIQDGWAAFIQHYFLSAWIPPRDQTSLYYSKHLGDGRFLLGMIGDAQQVPSGGSGRFEAELYAGPKLQDRLQAIAPGLELTVDYGMLTIIAKPIYWLLEVIHKAVGNWGWAIVLLTLLIKLAFFRLSAASYKSMAQMRKLQPRLVALKERYGDDRQRMHEAMMKVYKEEKINPLGGCLPILVQIPVFIALYWVLLESVELRQADFILWINDLSSADPFFVLPIIMGASMLVQHRLNPTPMDPIQAKVMMILPIVFTAFFAFFPAGLVLYWVVNNILSIAQQWYITRWVVKA